MSKITFYIQQIKQGEKTLSVPEEVLEGGDPAIEEWLYNEGYIDNALDYAITDTVLSIDHE